jgi:DNA-binding NarL/FixJ family response regulator
MDVLIVEDDPHKLAELEAFVLGRYPLQNVTHCQSLNTAVRTLDEKVFDLILLDMALPSHQLRPGNGPAVSLLSGGLEIVLELSYQGRPDPVIILTQHPEVAINGKLIPLRSVRSELMSQFSLNLIACIHYEYGKSAWKSKLDLALESLK